jgi:hypothetical protein
MKKYMEFISSSESLPNTSNAVIAIIYVKNGFDIYVDDGQHPYQVVELENNDCLFIGDYYFHKGKWYTDPDFTDPTNILGGEVLYWAEIPLPKFKHKQIKDCISRVYGHEKNISYRFNNRKHIVDKKDL